MIAFGQFYEPLYFLDALLLSLATAWLIGGLIFSFREAGQYHPKLLGAMLILLGWTTNVWWNNHEGQRWLLALTPIAFVGLLHWRELWREGAICRIAILLPIACLVNYGAYGLFDLLVPMYDGPVKGPVSASPKGPYRAAVFFTGDYFDGDGSIALIPDRFELSTLLDRPQREIATFVNSANILELRWETPTSLVVTLKPGTLILPKETSLHGVKITYRCVPEPQPLKSPGASAAVSKASQRNR